MVETSVAISNRTISYTDVGEGPSVLLLHGDTLDRRLWTTLIDDLAADYRVIAPDTRGHGKSPDTRGPFSYEDFADDWRILIDELQLGPITVIGHSGGACTALLMGLTYPELIRGMILAGCPYHVSNYREGSLESFENAKIDDYLAWAGDWASVAIDSYGSMDDYQVFWSRMFHELFPREPNLTPRELVRITPRTLVVHAEQESSFDVVHSEDLARLLPSAELMIAPGATHMTIFDHDPEFIHGAVRRFLASLDEPPNPLVSSPVQIQEPVTE